MHSACVGAGVDMTSACDIRYCSQDTWFQIRVNMLEVMIVTLIFIFYVLSRIFQSHSGLLKTDRNPLCCNGNGVKSGKKILRSVPIYDSASVLVFPYCMQIHRSHRMTYLQPGIWVADSLQLTIISFIHFSSKCSKPVVAAIHNACVGGGVDMTSACDIRYCSQDTWFQIKVNIPNMSCHRQF